MKFLMRRQSSWYISMFHYRNPGPYYSRVLVGPQVPYKPAYRLFLA